MTFKAAMGKALCKGLILSALVGVLFTMWANAPKAPVLGDEDNNYGRPAAIGSPDEVLARMGSQCWTGKAPADMAGKVPGHVVVRFREDGAGAAVVVRGSAIVGKALDQMFNGKDWHLDVFAFCR